MILMEDLCQFSLQSVHSLGKYAKRANPFPSWPPASPFQHHHPAPSKTSYWKGSPGSYWEGKRKKWSKTWLYSYYKEYCKTLRNACLGVMSKTPASASNRHNIQYRRTETYRHPDRKWYIFCFDFSVVWNLNIMYTKRTLCKEIYRNNY